MSLASDGDEDVAWAAFANTPSSYIHVELLRDIVGAKVSAEICHQLMNCGRLHDRLSALVSAHCQLPPIDDPIQEGQDRRIALASPSQLHVFVRRAGAICWSGTLSNAVRRDEVAELQTRLGSDVYEFAIRQRALSGPPQSLAPLDTLLTRMESDGWRCYAAWCDEVAPPIAARARLKAPPGSLDPATDPYFKDHGAEIFRQSVL